MTVNYPPPAFAQDQIDSEKVAVISESNFPEMAYKFRGSSEIVIDGISMTEHEEWLPASIHEIRPTKNSRNRICGYLFDEIVVSFKTPRGTTNPVFISVRDHTFYPPGCGQLIAGKKVVLVIRKLNSRQVKLLAILESPQVVEMVKQP